MQQEPIFHKDDRYKRTSFRAFNVRLPHRFDAMWWHERYNTKQWDREILTALSPNLASLHILDVGCATGRLLHALAEAGARYLYGADLAPAMVEVARRKLHPQYPTIELRVADAEDALPWTDEMFDVVILTATFHHFYRPVEALGEIHRVLRSEGRIIIIDPWFTPILRHVINGYLRLFHHDGDCRFYSQQKTVQLLRMSKFPTILCNKRIPRSSYLIIGGKKMPSSYQSL